MGPDEQGEAGTRETCGKRRRKVVVMNIILLVIFQFISRFLFGVGGSVLVVKVWNVTLSVCHGVTPRQSTVFVKVKVTDRSVDLRCVLTRD